jgi:Domain of unknown function (DUF3854)
MPPHAKRLGRANARAFIPQKTEERAVHASNYITLADLELSPGASGEGRAACPRQCSRKRKSRDVAVNLSKGVGLCHRCGMSFRLGDSPSRPFPRPPKPPTDPSPRRANAGDRHRVYSALLTRLHLNSEHRRNLRERGFSDDQIAIGGYRSLPIEGRTRLVRDLMEQFGEEVCATVPGFVRKERDRNCYWTLSGSAGLMIPARDLEKRIVGITIRANDHSQGPRYSWMSSAGYNGPSPGALLHVSIHGASSGVLRVTEGFLKADLATVLSGILTIGVPGVGQWRAVLHALELLRPDTILLAWDADWRSNCQVAKTLGDAVLELNRLGYDVRMESWQPGLGKGIDDLLRAGHQPQRQPWTAALAAKMRGTAIRSQPEKSLLDRATQPISEHQTLLDMARAAQRSILWQK